MTTNKKMEILQHEDDWKKNKKVINANKNNDNDRNNNKNEEKTVQKEYQQIKSILKNHVNQKENISNLFLFLYDYDKKLLKNTNNDDKFIKDIADDIAKLQKIANDIFSHGGKC